MSFSLIVCCDGFSWPKRKQQTRSNWMRSDGRRTQTRNADRPRTRRCRGRRRKEGFGSGRWKRRENFCTWNWQEKMSCEKRLLGYAGWPTILVFLVFLKISLLFLVFVCFYAANFATNIKMRRISELCEYQNVKLFATFQTCHSVADP